jgi:hypothetical protein
MKQPSRTAPAHLQTGPRIRLASAAIKAAVLLLTLNGSAQAMDFGVSGRVMFGGTWRVEAQDPYLLYRTNAALVGLQGYATSGQNSDDASLNFMKNDMVSRAVRGHLDFTAKQGDFQGLVRLKGWYDFALKDDARPWGHTINGFAPGQPLSDAGVPRLSRFTGLVVADAYVENKVKAGAMPLFFRVGQQSLPWGERFTMPGGLNLLNPIDAPALRRPGATVTDLRVPIPLLFARATVRPAFDVEAWYQTRFRPTATDPCGVLGAPVDYNVEGCNIVFTGGGTQDDRTRLRSGAYSTRIASPTSTDSSQFGAALVWRPQAGTELGLYMARYTNRTSLPGLRKSSRVGPAIVPFDPDGKNQTFFTEYPTGIRLYALNGSHKRGKTTYSAELAYRPNQPLQLPPGDVIPPFLLPTVASLLRADADAVAPGGLYHGYDQHRTAQLQLGLAHDWGLVGKTGLVTSLEVVAKHAFNLPDQRVRRYGRADHFGVGPVNGVCTPNAPRPDLQCSLDGYVSSNAFAYRLRVDARLGQIAPGLMAAATAQLTHDVKGWSYDLLVNEGRKVASLALRTEYRQRYLAEIVYQPNWGGSYNHHADRDQLSVAVGVKF